MTATIALIDVRDLRISPDSENLGLARIASYLREQDVQISLSVVDSAQNIDRQIQMLDQEARIFGFALFHTNYEAVATASALIKSRIDGAFIVVGGLFASEYAEKILAECPVIDGVIVGHGEFPVEQLAEAYPVRTNLAGIAGLVTRESGRCEQGQRPTLSPGIRAWWPARDFIVSAARRPAAIAHLYRKVGCSNRCTFCLMNSSGNRPMKKMALRKTDDLVHEIRTLYERNGFRIFMFHDCPFDDYGKEGVAQIEALCDQLHDFPQQLAFQCMMNGRYLKNHTGQVIQKMRETGFSQILFLLGSGNDRDRELIKNQKDLAAAEQMIAQFSQADIEVMIEFFMLNPASSAETLKENYLFLTRMGSYRLGDFIRKAPAYEGTPLHRLAVDNNSLLDTYSYRSPYEYTFTDDAVREVSSFFETLKADSRLMGNDYHLQNQVYLINWLKVLFPDAVSPHLADFDTIKREIHRCLALFLQEIFVGASVEYARRHLSHFKDDMSALCKKATALQFQLFRETSVKQYLLRS